MGRGKIGGKAVPDIANKQKRAAVVQRMKKEGGKTAKEKRRARQKEAAALGEDAPDLSKQQRTLESTREADLTVVPDAGHSCFEPGILSALVEACDRFADLQAS